MLYTWRMSATKITANFPDFTSATRTSEAAYTHASRRQAGGQVRFHTSERAARSAAGRFGEVVRTDYAAPASDTPASATFRVTFSDDTEMTVEAPMPASEWANPFTAPTAAAEAAHPGKTVARVSKVA